MSTFGNLLAFSPELWLLAGAVVVFLLAGGLRLAAMRVSSIST